MRPAPLGDSPVRSWFHWTPRVLGLLFSLFVALFALDVFDGRYGLDLALALGVHLAPAAMVLAATFAGWRRPVVGGLLFMLLAGGYVLLAGPDRPWSWYLAIAAPAAFVGALFLAAPFLGRTRGAT